MSKRKILLCSLALLLTVFSSVASATAPYASIIAYNEMAPGWGVSSSNPEVSPLGVLDIINMTPWDISIGPGQNQPMLPGLTTGQSFNGFWLAGFHKPTASANNFGNSFAFHSYQVALNNLNNAWALKNEVSNVYGQPLWWDSVPLVFNSNTFAQGGNTVALNFIVTSSAGFDVNYNSATANFPATALSFGDGTNSYGFETNDTMIYFSNWKNTTHFLTVQGTGSNENNWKPIVANLGGINTNSGGYGFGSAPSTPVKAPKYLNVSGMAYPNFSAVAGDNQGLDLVVIIQSPGYGDMQLIFLAVPGSNDGFLKGL
ncbi:MAG: hypothetical protein P4N59_08110 [Negativicutes bacterium]|nr:hypothetical protein [Negativicutes bacterium]